MAVMVSKSELLTLYVQRCEESKEPRNLALYKYLEEQAIQQNVERERAEQEDYTIEEGNHLDLMFRGNDKLNFSSKITDSNLYPLVGSLVEHAILIQHIDLRFNLISDTGAIILSNLLKPAVNLQTLYLQSNNIGEEGAKKIAECLENHERLLYLNLNGNQIGTPGANALVQLLFSCPAVVELDIGNNYIDHYGIIAITTALNRARLALEVLNLENPKLNSIMQETAVHFGQMLSINQTLQKLSLKKFKLRCDGIFTISQHLMENSTLKVLDLSCNEISADGAEYISRYIKSQYCGLESLILGVNKIVDLGAKSIAQALAINQSLIHVDLSKNNIGDEGLSRLAEALFHNPKLLSFKLYGNHFDQQSLKLFYRLFQTPRDNEWYPDFTAYYVDEQVQMAYIETEVPYDIYV